MPRRAQVHEVSCSGSYGGFLRWVFVFALTVAHEALIEFCRCFKPNIYSGTQSLPAYVRCRSICPASFVRKF